MNRLARATNTHQALLYLRVLPGAEAEYDRRFATIWPALAAEIRDSGLRNSSGFRRGTDVWHYLEGDSDVAGLYATYTGKPANQRWSHWHRDVVAQITDESGEPLWYDLVFRSDGPSLPAPFERALFSLVIDPERAADYDALHADPWPDLVAALEESGFRNYSGFRRDAHVVYYGEFYPDMRTAFARFAEHEVSTRWSKAFEGVITTITDAEGNLLIASEFFHQD